MEPTFLLRICNASPIILLSKAESLFLLTESADRVMVPNGVKRKLSVKTDNNIKDFLNHRKVEVVSVRKLNPKVLEWGLGRGESEAISLALENSRSEVVLDDKLGRKCAKTLSSEVRGTIKIRGTVGIVVLAKKEGIITEARPVIQKLKDAGIYLSDKWLSEVLSIVDEKWE